MSVFGGDSWAREAQYRKRRVNDLITEGLDASSYKKLPNGKFTCLVCRHSPVLDTPLTLSMHVKGSRHRAVEKKRREEELWRKEEIKKRVALSDTATTSSSGNLANKISSICGRKDVKSGPAESSHSIPVSTNDASAQLEVDKGVVGQKQLLDYRVRREKELKFTAAGWKRDGNGKWFKDENVEFDSDEEDPNIALNDHPS